MATEAWMDKEQWIGGFPEGCQNANVDMLSTGHHRANHRHTWTTDGATPINDEGANRLALGIAL